jgi:hypothetical protein
MLDMTSLFTSAIKPEMQGILLTSSTDFDERPLAAAEVAVALPVADLDHLWAPLRSCLGVPHRMELGACAASPPPALRRPRLPARRQPLGSNCGPTARRCELDRKGSDGLWVLHPIQGEEPLQLASVG